MTAYKVAHQVAVDVVKARSFKMLRGFIQRAQK